MDPIRVLVVSGSSRAGSYNRRLARIAAGMAEAAGAQVDECDLRELVLPIYDGDIEAAGMPGGAYVLRQQFAEHDALLVASPEYNGFPTPLLLNAFDWASRPMATDSLPAGTAALAGKVAGLVSASPGGLGGLRNLIFLRQFLSLNLGMLVVAEQFALPAAAEAFDGAGGLVEAGRAASLQRVVASVLHVASGLKPTAA